jgi:hypothetical protein
MSFKLNSFGTNSSFAPNTIFSSSVSSDSAGGTGTNPILEPVLETGTTIDFEVPKIYNSNITPGTTDIMGNLTNAKLGVIQKIYHKVPAFPAPTFPAGWVKMTMGMYIPGSTNVIFAQWAGGMRVEYWIIQEVP